MSLAPRTVALMELAARHRAKRFVLTSTVGQLAHVGNAEPGGEPAQIVDELLRLAIVGAKSEDLAELDHRITLAQALREFAR